MNKNIFGWILVILGLIIIFWALIASYNIFTLKSDPPQFFDIQDEIEKSQTVNYSSDSDQEQIEDKINEIIAEKFKEIIPDDVFSVTSNLIIWSILAGIMIFSGSQISLIGTRLIKDNEIKE